MRELQSVERLEAIARRAVHNGYYPATTVVRGVIKIRRHIRWDVSGRCESPLPVEMFARYSAQHGKLVKPMTVLLDVPCRTCGWCRKKRHNQWAAKAAAEFNGSNRTWFCTLTLTPEEHFLALTRARERYAEWDALTDAARFARLVGSIGNELTKFIKRIRKNSRAPIKYLLVAEAHKSGLPHFHALIHEKDALRPVRKTILKEAWRSGFAKFALADDARSAVYLCKYLAKDARTRIRASFRYGETHQQDASLHRLKL